MRNLIRLATAALGVAAIVFSAYVLGWGALNGEHYVRGVMLAVTGAVLVAAGLRAWRRNEPLNPVMMGVASLLVILSSVVGLVF
jgi:hypothetical protein